MKVGEDLVCLSVSVMAPDMVRAMYSLILFDYAVFKTTPHVQPMPYKPPLVTCMKCAGTIQLLKRANWKSLSQTVTVGE